MRVAPPSISSRLHPSCHPLCHSYISPLTYTARSKTYSSPRRFFLHDVYCSFVVPPPLETPLQSFETISIPSPPALRASRTRHHALQNPSHKGDGTDRGAQAREGGDGRDFTPRLQGQSGLLQGPLLVPHATGQACVFRPRFHPTARESDGFGAYASRVSIVCLIQK